MAIRCYLAMTAAEFRSVEPLPVHLGWMACHFSIYSTGLSNLPQELPEAAMVIVNDRPPVQGHDPEQILEQLTIVAEQWKPDCFLLDMQRPNSPQTEKIVRLLTERLPYPVGVTEGYAADLDCAVLLPPCPLLTPLAEHIAPWTGREIWLDIAPEEQTAVVDREGCKITDGISVLPDTPEFIWEHLHCRYQIQVLEDRAIFHLRRDKELLHTLLQDAEQLGITRTVGLYQQLAPIML